MSQLVSSPGTFGEPLSSGGAGGWGLCPSQRTARHAMAQPFKGTFLCSVLLRSPGLDKDSSEGLCAEARPLRSGPSSPVGTPCH